MVPRRLATRALIGPLLVLALVAGPGSGLAAGFGWSIVLSPTTIPAATASTIKAVITNQGGPDGTRELGCVRISLPLTFAINSATVTSRPPNTAWSASAGIGTVTVRSGSGGDRLPPDGKTSVTAAIAVLVLTPGTYTWTANAYRQGDCTDGFNEPMSLKVTVELVILPTPAATPTPVLTPAPTPTPAPTVHPTIQPSILPSLLPTPPPTAPPAPTPAPTGTPAPATTATPAPGGTAVPVATPGGSDGGPGSTPTAQSATARPTAVASDDPPDARPSATPALGAALLFPGGGPGDGSTDASEPAISLTSGFETPFGPGFEWAVPGLVLSVPGLLIVLIAIGAQAFGAAAWLPVVRRRIGGFELDRRNERA